eukprot:scaffold13780_cov241-Alexandrium_tamarense.AAC.2
MRTLYTLHAVIFTKTVKQPQSTMPTSTKEEASHVTEAKLLGFMPSSPETNEGASARGTDSDSTDRHEMEEIEKGASFRRLSSLTNGGLSKYIHGILDCGDSVTTASSLKLYRCQEKERASGLDVGSSTLVPALSISQALDVKEMPTRSEAGRHNLKEKVVMLMVVTLLALSLGLLGVILASVSVRGDASENNIPDIRELPSPSNPSFLKATKIVPPPTSSNYSEEDLFKMSERVNEACSEHQLGIDVAECQHLCKEELCCFDLDEQYNCLSDRERNCVAYVGCRVLIEKVFVYGPPAL